MSGLSFPTFPSVPSMTQEAQDFVEEMLTDARSDAETARDRALEAIDELKTAIPPTPLPSPPSAPSIVTTFSASLGGTNPSVPSIGEITAPSPPTFTAEEITVPNIVAQIPEYTALVTGISMPGAPTIEPVVMPTPPSIDTDVELPAAPTRDYGDLPTLLPYELETYVAPTIDPFDDTPPEFTAEAPSSGILWTEPQYTAWIADQLKTVLQELLAGGTGIAPTVERAIWERDRSRIDAASRKAIQEATDEFASSGFTLPGAALLARTMDVRRDNSTKVAQLSRDVAIKQADLEQTNRQFAVKSGAELEGMFSQIFLQTMDRSFQIAKYAVEARILVFNAQVAAFNAEQAAFGQRVEAFKARLLYVQAQLDAYKTRLEAEKVKGEINKDLLDAYRAKIAAFQAQVDAYRALVQAATTKAELQRGKVELYRAQIDGVRGILDVKKSEFDGYEARIRGESAKAGLEEANSRAYAARVNALSSVADIGVKQAEVSATVAGYKLQAHLGELRRISDLVGQQLAAIQARGAAWEATVRRDTADFEYRKEAKALEINTTIEANRTAIARYQAQLESWKANVAHMLSSAQIVADSMKAVAQVAGTLAAGAFAGTSVAASFNGAVSRGENTSQSETYGESKSESTQTSSSVSTSTNTNINISS